MPDRLTLATIKRDLTSRQTTVSRIVNECLRKIAKLDEEYKTFITVFDQQASHDAEELDQLINQGKPIRFLFGAPISLKDNICIKAHKTTAATKLFENFLPTKDAEVVASLRRSKTIVLGKNNLHALALGATSTSSLFGPVRNPYAKDRIAGGSSGGTTVAVALSMVAAGLGTDTGGSIRIPAAFCGVVGFKPTYGLLSLDGVIPLSPTLDHVGPITATVEDSYLIFKAMTGALPADPLQWLEAQARKLLQKRARVAIPQNYLQGLDERVERDFFRKLERVRQSGFTIEETALPNPSRVHSARVTIMLKEASILYAEPLSQSADQFPEDVRKLLSTGISTPARAYIEALLFRSHAVTGLLNVFRRFDFIAMPTVPILPPKLEEVVGEEAGAIRNRLLLNTGLFNLTGMPAITLPMSGENGLFTGLQLAARPFDDESLLVLAHLVEKL